MEMLWFTMIKNEGKADVMELINCILGSLVSITAGCFLYRAWEALLIGLIGGIIASATVPLFDKIHIDDPVSASAVHGACGIWGVIAVGLFADNPIPMDTTNGRSGLFKGGGWYLLGVQTLAAICLTVWAIIITMLLLWVIDKIMPIRMDPYEELLGADLTEHRIRHGQVGVSRAVSALRPYHRTNSIEEVGGVGVNTGHSMVIDKIYEAQKKKKSKRKGELQMFTNEPETNQPPYKIKNNGFLNKRQSTTELHRTINSMASEIHGLGLIPSKKSKLSNQQVLPEEKNEVTISVVNLEDLEEASANEDRFRHRFHHSDYNNDMKRANLTWID